MSRQLARVGTGALVAAALFASCGGGGSENPDRAATSSAATTTVSSVPETTTTAQQSEQEAILAAVEGYWRSLFEANSPPDPDHPDLARYRTGAALEVARQNVRERVDRGEAFRWPENSVTRHDPVVTALGSEGLAFVADCAVDDGIVYDVATGEILDDDVGTFLWLLTLVKEDGVWKVAEATIQMRWEGVAECPE